MSVNSLTEGGTMMTLDSDFSSIFYIVLLWLFISDLQYNYEVKKCLTYLSIMSTLRCD